ncbi:tetratricopeptide repeat-containing sulfotransferase family protein [Aestuariispira insulae]
MDAFGLRDHGRFGESRKLAERILQQVPREPHCHYLLGSLALQAGDLPGAEKSFRAGIDADKKGHMNQGGMGLLLLRRNEAGEALRWLKLAHQKAPKDPSHLCNLALANELTGQPNRAINLFRKAVTLAPNYLPAIYHLSRLLLNDGQYSECSVLLTEGLKRFPADEGLLSTAANLQSTLGNLEETEKLYRQLNTLAPNKVEVQRKLVAIAIQKGQLEEAEQGLSALLKRNPHDLFALATAIRLKRADSILAEGLRAAIDGALGLIECGKGQKDWSEDEFYHAFVVADFADETQVAFKALEQANKIRREALKKYGHSYDRRDQERYVEALKAFPGWRQLLNEAVGSQDERPVFVVGMPRSGTTLVEQVVSAHAMVAGAGEREALKLAVHAIAPQPAGIQCSSNWMENLLKATPEKRQEIAAGYLTEYDKAFPGALRVVDKMPHNFTYLGFAAALFPNARFIHCRRSKVATGFSIFQQNFASNYLFDTDLSDIAHAQNIQEELMDFWKSLMGERIYDVSYESLVSNPEQEIRSLINFLGVAWDDACLKHHEQKNTVITASQHQVRQPINIASRDHFHRYADFLGPLMN